VRARHGRLGSLAGCLDQAGLLNAAFAPPVTLWQLFLCLHCLTACGNSKIKGRDNPNMQVCLQLKQMLLKLKLKQMLLSNAKGLGDDCRTQPRGNGMVRMKGDEDERASAGMRCRDEK